MAKIPPKHQKHSHHHRMFRFYTMLSGISEVWSPLESSSRPRQWQVMDVSENRLLVAQNPSRSHMIPWFIFMTPHFPVCSCISPIQPQEFSGYTSFSEHMRFVLKCEDCQCSLPFSWSYCRNLWRPILRQPQLLGLVGSWLFCLSPSHPSEVESPKDIGYDPPLFLLILLEIHRDSMISQWKSQPLALEIPKIL